MQKRRKIGAAVLVLAAVASAVTGCGGARYAASINAATARLEEARAVGADRLAPYEYYSAKELLQRARVEAGGSYSDATQYADVAERYAEKAIQVAQSARRPNR